jgi:competence protein ComEA
MSLALAAVAGALVMVVLGWPRGQSVPAAAPTTDASSQPLNVLSDPTPSASAADVVVVDVAGKVKHSGVVELPAGSRVIDALKAAGGVTGHGDTSGLNLAEVLIDGTQILVPSVRATDQASSSLPGAPAADGSTAPSAGSGDLVSINSATAEELETLPGIGPVLAAAIVQWRSDNRGFQSIEQLQEVSGIGPATFADLAPLVRL